MKREYPDRPIVGVGAVIVQDGRAVVVKRGTEPLRGEWSIPGGVLEIGETLRAGAEREALEETGLVVQAGEVLGVFDRVVPGEDGRTRFHYVLIDFICQRVSGELRAGGDATEARWVTVEQLAGISIAEPAAGLIRKALKSNA
jgi:ADP-ribose pyrophosphatase YjhB (NUDIX family)